MSLSMVSFHFNYKPHRNSFYKMCSEAAKRAPGGKHLREAAPPREVAKYIWSSARIPFFFAPSSGLQVKASEGRVLARGYAREVTSFARNHSVRLNEQSVAGPGRCTCCWYNSLDASDCAFKWVWPGETRPGPHPRFQQRREVRKSLMICICI